MDIIEQLKSVGIELSPGLSADEISQIEAIYGVHFPDSLRLFFSEALPVSEGFYNWRDYSEENVYFIKAKMNQPFDDLVELAPEVSWNESWGEQPNSSERVAIEVKRRLKDAPKLIPFYKHRYMPMIEVESPPVLSVYGTDIIIYGNNIEDYIKREFAKEKVDTNYADSNLLGFWSEIM